MNTENQECKNERIASLQESLRFFSNRNKLNREIWVVESFLKRLGVNYEEVEIIEADEPADVAYKDARFQIKEIVPEGRRRTDEYKKKLETAVNAEDQKKLLEQYTPSDICFTEIVECCRNYADSLISSNKYGIRERENTDLLFYFNFVGYHEIPPEEYSFEVEGFRSFSVVGNRYCAVLKSSEHAPQFLKENVGKVVNSIEVYG